MAGGHDPEEESAGLEFLLPPLRRGAALVVAEDRGGIGRRLGRLGHRVAMLGPPGWAPAKRATPHGSFRPACICGGRPGEYPLPIQDATLDLVILGSLSGVGVNRGAPSRLDLERTLLQELRRILRPGGCLYLAAENGLYGRLLASTPNAGSLPALPGLRTLVAGLLHGRRAGALHHTLWGYRSLLGSAGFDELTFYLPLPSPDHPHCILQVQDRVIRYFARTTWPLHTSLSWRQALKWTLAGGLARMGLLKYLWPAYSITARAGQV